MQELGFNVTDLVARRLLMSWGLDLGRLRNGIQGIDLGFEVQGSTLGFTLGLRV